MQEILGNEILWSVLAALCSAQVLKVVTVFISEGKLDAKRLKGTGGMPSSHSSSVTALATSVGFQEGFGSTEFSIAVVLAFVVMYDAVGIRQAAGRHAERLNMLSDQLAEIADTFKDGFEPEKLKTLLGHTLPQVFFGALLGIGISLLFYL
ncbi:MAG: divergent PAP2 family protein [Spirochaetales bacterium]|nr:divergent PAP2 family protein [Spirochaetales bacterium]